MKIELSVDGITETEWADDRKRAPSVRVVTWDGRATDQVLSADELLSQIASLVPVGTRLRLTVETVSES